MIENRHPQSLYDAEPILEPMLRSFERNAGLTISIQGNATKVRFQYTDERRNGKKGGQCEGPGNTKKRRRPVGGSATQARERETVSRERVP